MLFVTAGNFTYGCNFDLQINEYMIFHVKTSHFIPRIFYQVCVGNCVTKKRKMQK